MKLILICKEGESRQAYLTEIATIGVDVDVVSSYSEFLNTKAINSYQGLMVDLVTQMKMSADERIIAKDILEFYPTIQLKWDAESGSISNISFGKSATRNTMREFISIRDFISSECQSFKARAIRQSMRKMIHFNVLLSTEERMDEKYLERTVTINMSKSGCFVFSGRVWTKYPTVWFIMNDLKDKTLISGDIRWSVEWGKRRVIPGIGIRFKQIKPSQIEELIGH
jgi:hypothetical protein